MAYETIGLGFLGFVFGVVLSGLCRMAYHAIVGIIDSRWYSIRPLAHDYSEEDQRLRVREMVWVYWNSMCDGAFSFIMLGLATTWAFQRYPYTLLLVLQCLLYLIGVSFVVAAIMMRHSYRKLGQVGVANPIQQ